MRRSIFGLFCALSLLSGCSEAPKRASPAADSTQAWTTHEVQAGNGKLEFRAPAARPHGIERIQPSVILRGNLVTVGLLSYQSPKEGSPRTTIAITLKRYGAGRPGSIQEFSRQLDAQYRSVDARTETGRYGTLEWVHAAWKAGDGESGDIEIYSTPFDADYYLQLGVGYMGFEKDADALAAARRLVAQIVSTVAIQ